MFEFSILSSPSLFDDVSSVCLLLFFMFTQRVNRHRNVKREKMDSWKNDETLFNEYLCCTRENISDFYQQLLERNIFALARFSNDKSEETDLKYCAIIPCLTLNPTTASAPATVKCSYTHFSSQNSARVKSLTHHLFMLFICFVYVSFLRKA